MGERLNPDTFETMGESKFETFDEAPEVEEDFQSVLDMANRTGLFAPEAQIVGGNTSGITGEITVESIEPAENDDGFETVDEDQLDLSDFRSVSNNTESLSSGGYDIQSFGRSGGDMVSGQFGGDSTIARMNTFEEMSPEDQFAEHADNISTFGDSAGDVGNVQDVAEDVPETIPELPEGYSNYDVPDVSEDTFGDIGTGASETVEGVSEGVSEGVEGVSEISEIATEATEGLTVATDVLDSAALATDSAAAATAPIPGVDIAVAAIGGLVTAAAIGSSIGLGISSAVQNANKTAPITPTDIPVQQQSLAGKYVGVSATQNYYGDNN